MKTKMNSSFVVREGSLRRIIREELHTLFELDGDGNQPSGGGGVEIETFKTFLVGLLKKNGADPAATANLSRALDDIAKTDVSEILKALSTPELAALGKVFLALVESDDPADITKAAALLKNAKQKK